MQILVGRTALAVPTLTVKEPESEWVRIRSPTGCVFPEPESDWVRVLEGERNRIGWQFGVSKIH